MRPNSRTTLSSRPNTLTSGRSGPLRDEAAQHSPRLWSHVQYERWELAVARDGYRGGLAAYGNLQFRTKHGHALALRRYSQQLRLLWILDRMRGILQHHFRVSGDSGGDRLFQRWNQRDGPKNRGGRRNSTYHGRSGSVG